MTRRFQRYSLRWLGWQGIAAVLAVTGGAAALVAAWGAGRYLDDTYSALRPPLVTLSGEQGLVPVRLGRTIAPNGVVDARGAIMVVASSRNEHPTAARTCQKGALPSNPYPLVIGDQAGVALVGGLFAGRVPQSADWRATYCNSAAVLFQNAPGGIIDGVRITRSWDAIRAGRGSAGLLVTNSWLSEARDDALENDHLLPLTVRDTLIDGTFNGVSVKPAKTNEQGDASDRTVRLSGVLLRLAAYPYEGELRLGALAKSEERSPALNLTNSVIALDGGVTGHFPRQWRWTWAKLVRPSNNLFLWLSDGPVPPEILPPADAFRILRGAAARQAWARARTNWINCHPRLARLPTDPQSDPRACVADTWGGYTN